MHYLSFPNKNSLLFENQAFLLNMEQAPVFLTLVLSNGMSIHLHIHTKSTQVLFGLVGHLCICQSHDKKFHLLFSNL